MTLSFFPMELMTFEPWFREKLWQIFEIETKKGTLRKKFSNVVQFLTPIVQSQSNNTSHARAVSTETAMLSVLLLSWLLFFSILLSKI